MTYPEPEKWHEAREIFHQMRKDMLRKACSKARNRQEAAHLLGIPYATFVGACHKYNIHVSKPGKRRGR